ncbi:MAG: hypothetical protein IGS03_11000 [Candidatus Sericytochromatia bacterium]|nr:hypothetical protein [Candidatus Sericytochromatia bacterium]
MAPGSSPTLVSPRVSSQSGVSSQYAQQLAQAQQEAAQQNHQVSFRVDLPGAGGGFSTQQVATAQYAKLEIWNKYFLDAMGQRTPIYANGADENGFVPVSGNQFLLGADVPGGFNWVVTLRLYSNNNDQSEIQQLKAAFHVPSEEVVINQRTTVAARILEALQTTLSPLQLGYELDGTVSNPQFQIKLDLDKLQAFADAFTGADSNPTANFPATEQGGNEPELALPVSNSLVRFSRIEALTPESEEGMALPPPISLADIDFFKIAEHLSDGIIQADHSLAGSTLELTAESGQNANPADYRFPLFLVGRQRLQQRDSTGGTLAFNPETKRLFLNNRVLDVTIRDSQETIQAVQLLGNGQFGGMVFRNDLNRIDSPHPALGVTRTADDTSCNGGPGSQPAVFVMSRRYANPVNLEGNVPGNGTVYALRQDNLQTLWRYDFAQPADDPDAACQVCAHDDDNPRLLDMNRTRFVPVLDREGEGCAQTDVVYAAFNGVNSDFPFRGIYKIKDGQLVGFAPLYKASKVLGGQFIENELDHNGNTLPVRSSQLNFTTGGALSEKLYTDTIKDADGNVTGETVPSKRLFALTGAQNNETNAPELVVIDVNENNPLDGLDQELQVYGNLRRLRFPLPQGEMLHENSSPVIDQLPNGEEVVYFTAYKMFNVGGNNFDSEGYLYAYHPASRQLAKVYTTEAKFAVTGQTNFPPTLANIGGETHIYVANDYGEVHSFRQGNNWNDPLILNWKTQVGRMRPPLMLFGSPDVVKKTDGSLALYIASSTVDGRIYELNPVDGEVKSQIFPGGFFSAGNAFHDGYMYITTRSGNYGDFTYLRSLKVDVQGLATNKADAPWPKIGGNYANTGNAVAPAF